MRMVEISIYSVHELEILLALGHINVSDFENHVETLHTLGSFDLTLEFDS